MAEWNSAPASSTATIFSGDTPQANAALVNEWLEKAYKDAVEEDNYNWYLQNRGVMQPDGSYFGAELVQAPELNYDPNVRQVGQPMRKVEGRADYDERMMDNVGDLILGYDPREGVEDEDDSDAKAALFLGSFSPGKVGRLAGAAFGADVAYDVAKGRYVPGVLDMMWLGGMGKNAAKKAAKMYYQDKLTRAVRKRSARNAARKAIQQPTIRMQDARTGKWIEVSPYIEEVPSEVISTGPYKMNFLDRVKEAMKR